VEVVADTTVVIAVLVNEPQKPDLVRATAGVTLVSPTSLPWEIGNAFSAMFKAKRLSARQAADALKDYRAIPIQLVEVDLDVAVDLSAKLGIYAYDAYMIVCSLKRNAPLLTLDRRLKAAATNAGARVLEVTP
jgi:predicted nucleic acid-binding protein